MDFQEKDNEITPTELSHWIKEGKHFFLLDILGNDHFSLIHLPKAHMTCVFEVSFIDQVKAITEDREAVIVLYGSSERSMDAATAAWKLEQEGYCNIQVLKGGIEAWRRAGMPLEGAAIDSPGDPQTLLNLKQENRTYQVITDQSIIQWAGRNSNSSHYGTIGISKGALVFKNGKFTGTFDIDMNSIDCLDLEGNELKPVLIAHLSSDDFFLTRLFPSATYEIESAAPIKEPFLSIPNFEVNGKLKLRGAKARQDFMATVTKTPEDGLVAEAHFDIDRTRWGVIYGSTRFFEYLGMHLVFDLISLQIRVVAY